MGVASFSGQSGLPLLTSSCPQMLLALLVMVPSSTAAGSMVHGLLFRLRITFTYKELHLILLASMVWGPLWSSCWILFQCDNEAVVAVINSDTSRNDDVMHLLTQLV